MKKVLWIEELDPMTDDVRWHQVNRRKINEGIRMFNQWQIGGFDDFKKEVLLARIKSLRTYGETSDFADWQFDILNEMRSHIQEISN